jgi:acyl-CoA reductase-like NAD-dependent aldehyde dehydrogenase
LGAVQDVAPMTVRDTLFIGGGWVLSRGDPIPVVNPASEAVIASVPASTPADVDDAVRAARASFDAWAATPLDERLAHVDRLRERLAGRAEEIGRTVAEDAGMPVALATLLEGTLAGMSIESYMRVARELPWEERLENSLVLREPAGVVAAITPGTFPLSEAVLKVAPALIAGCTVVLKPSDVAPLAPLILAEAAADAGLPPGVLNLVTGGPATGAALAGHDGVDAVSLTGSTAVGRRVAALAAPTLKRLTLELGGKSACIVLDDADLGAAVGLAVSQCLLNSGQTCVSWSRLLVPRERQAEAAQIARETAEGYAVGDPLADGTVLGPLTSAAQRDRVRSHIRRASAEGATLVTGGEEPPDGLERGFYVRPTVFADVDNAMAVAREEVFGPVVAILPYDGEEQAIAIANDSIYGLHGAVFSGDDERAERVARRLRTGGVDVNGGAPNLVAPVGGYKQSGIGREQGRAGLEEYLELKSIQLRAS